MNRLILAAVAFAASTAALAAPAEPPFIVKAIQGDMAEVQMGQLAEKQGSTPAVRAYGTMLAKDHAAHRVTAEGIAKSMQVAPPAGLGPDQIAAYDELKGKTGKDFDSAFIDHMIMDHNRDINAYQDQFANGKGLMPRLAVKTLPVLKAHLAEAVRLKG